ncbi:AraC family transcriptional regulator [Gordonia sihwensis]|uniref:helix-turn-helix domain-containing protein n=1 Tax=Gordonia TaxID=2053 RepID=UPI001C92E9F8|nr:AraC family transcriptional regulator [Gordonia sihwensis]MBY4571154.1 AraC family transcriptional regulator [Gordonia sihwensis]WFN91635.1 AraC family transcriptional regulator [Gordonia sihwensis]
MAERVPSRLATLVPDAAPKFLGHGTHSHHLPHLIYVAAGSATLDVAGEQVLLGDQEAVWLAADLPHSARYSPGSLVLGPLLSPTTTPPEPVHRLGSVPALTAVMTGVLGAAPSTAEQVAVFREAIEEVLAGLSGPYFALPMPRHPVAAAIAVEAPLSARPLDELADRHGTSVRHVQRLFVSETGIPFRQWRVRARLNVAIDRLRAGSSVRRAALAAGYETASGLQKALRREAGVDAESIRSVRRTRLTS